jgi:phage repressor protein C with HTH and peptisase S24 domain
MLTHQQIWAVIDALAERHGLSASKLALRSGLNPTAFNRSKRIGADGRLRWPSTESLTKVLESTQTSFDDFIALLRDQSAPAPEAKSSNLAQLPQFLQAESHQRMVGFSDADAAVSLSVQTGGRRVFLMTVEDDLCGPFFRLGTRLVLEASDRFARGDRMLAIEHSGVRHMIEVHRWQRKALVSRIGTVETYRLDRAGLIFTARLLWASQ